MSTHRRTIEQREDHIRKLLARGLYDHEILEACEGHALFRFQNRKKDGSFKQLTRRSLRVYLYQVKRELRELVPEGPDALAEGLERLRHAYRVAVKENNVAGMVAVQRCINRMLGLRKEAASPAAFDVDEFRQQFQAMYATVGVKRKGSQSQAENNDPRHAT